jgi:hypothetical protein
MTVPVGCQQQAYAMLSFKHSKTAAHDKYEE